ncbi:hypothetical protein ACQR50_16805 [Sphingomonas sp. Xoc002]|uniref:hypothetical protein n=1 Tax=Sphingomonas sp. Xoc002 TaxID=2837624 RepID=UPI003D16D471
MARRLWARIIRDWENQPLAIIGQALSIIIALSLALWGAPNALPKPASAQPLADASYALAITVLIASASAGVSRYGFRKSFVAGFCLSLILASACLLIFAILGAPYLAKTSRLIQGSYDGPLMDVGYWTVFLIFVVVCSSTAVNRMVLSSQNLKPAKEGDQQDRGVTVFEVLIAAFIWVRVCQLCSRSLSLPLYFKHPRLKLTR